jgi:hypothetical protein
MAGGGAFLIGTHHGDPMTPQMGFRREGLDALRKDPIVIADENAKRD